MPRPTTIDLDQIDGERLFRFLLRRPGECDRAITLGKRLGITGFIGHWTPEQCREVVGRMGRIRRGVN